MAHRLRLEGSLGIIISFTGASVNAAPGLRAGWPIPAACGGLETGRAPALAGPVQYSPAIVNVEVEGLTVAVHAMAALAPAIGRVPRATVEPGRSYAPAPEVYPGAGGEVLAAIRSDEHAHGAGSERVARQLGSELSDGQRRVQHLSGWDGCRRRCTERADRLAGENHRLGVV